MDLSGIEHWKNLDYLRTGNARQLRAYDAIQTLRVSEVLASFDPVLVSTICLGIDLPSSDLDIICYAPDLRIFSRALESAFSQYPRFQLRIGSVDRVLATFWAEGFEFELFGAPVPVQEQAALQHLAITARLIEWGGEEFRELIRESKRSGLKTEPAIAKLLELPGDPYQAVLALKEPPESEVEQLVLGALARAK